MNKIKKHQPSDILIHYDVDKFKKIDELDSQIGVLDYPELLLLVALFGVNNNRRIDIKKNDDKGLFHSFSRTVYQRHEIQTESNFGLITILNNLDQDSNMVVSEMAFAKMHNSNTNFSKLPNVVNFYESLIGGIEPLYDMLFELGHDINSVATSLYDELMEDEEIYETIAAQMLLEESEKSEE